MNLEIKAHSGAGLTAEGGGAGIPEERLPPSSQQVRSGGKSQTGVPGQDHQDCREAAGVACF